MSVCSLLMSLKIHLGNLQLLNGYLLLQLVVNLPREAEKCINIYVSLHRYCTFMIIHSSVTVFMQQFLHPAECDGGEVTWVFQLEEALQVGRCLTPSHVHTLTVDCIQSPIKTILILDSTKQTVQNVCMVALKRVKNSGKKDRQLKQFLREK